MHPKERNQLDLKLAKGQFKEEEIVNFIGGVWATKEAVLKAMHCYIPYNQIPPAQTIYTNLFFKENTTNGVPRITFDDGFASRSAQCYAFNQKYIENKAEALLSISHDKDYLVAFVSLMDKKS